jgi:hypothetical protein
MALSVQRLGIGLVLLLILTSASAAQDRQIDPGGDRGGEQPGGEGQWGAAGPGGSGVNPGGDPTLTNKPGLSGSKEAPRAVGQADSDGGSGGEGVDLAKAAQRAVDTVLDNLPAVQKRWDARR